MDKERAGESRQRNSEIEAVILENAQLRHKCEQASKDLARTKEQYDRLLRRYEREQEFIRDIEENRYFGICRSNLSGDQLIHANRQFFQLIGIASNEAIGRKASFKPKDMYENPDDRDRLVKILQDHGHVVDFRCKLIRGQGSGEVFMASMTAWLKRGGDEIEGIMIDISNAHLEEMRFKDRDAILRRVFNLLPNQIFLKNADGNFLLVNQAMADFYGLTIDQLESLRDEDLQRMRKLSPESLQHYKTTDRAARERLDGDFHFSAPRPEKDAAGVTRYVETYKYCLREKVDGVPSRLVLGVGHDISKPAVAMQLHKALLYASDEMVNTVVKRTWQQLVSLTGATRSEALIKVHQNPRGGQTLRPLVCVGLPDCEFVVSSAADLYHQMLKANTPKFIDELRITHGDFLGDRLSGISAGLFTTANDYQYLFGLYCDRQNTLREDDRYALHLFAATLTSTLQMRSGLAGGRR